MGNQRIIKILNYLKLIVMTGISTVLIVIFLSAAIMASAVTAPLKSQVCCYTPADFGADFISMHFSSIDGLKLSGWYVPPRNGAVVILLHGYYNDRRQTLPVAEMLFKHGYGLLMYDQRASGESDGTVRSLGALDISDVRQAVNWLSSQQQEIKIGVYGCSMGAAISLAGASSEKSIRAVVADAPSSLRWFQELPPLSLHDPFSLPIMALYYSFVMLRSQTIPPISTVEAVQNYGARPVLFISAGNGGEFSRVSAYFEAASGPKTHWNIPEAGHCGGPSVRPDEYEQYLANFFNSSLLNK